ncbi:MAG TPA: FmdB family zinc ribbon protein [Blastocatellia bacterium]|nr:FmdB family zinc ribbon protein [Blastocatellia bacterium]
MPIYEYVCGKCGSQIEVIQKVGDQVLKRCSKCRGKLEKLVSRSGFQFKGSGWYLTDYSSKSKSPTTDAADKSAEKKPESTPASDAKPAATAAD